MNNTLFKVYLTNILNTIFKDKQFLNDFDAGNFIKFYESLSPEIWFEFTTACIEAGIDILDERINSHYDEQKSHIELYRTNFIHESSFAYEFGYDSMDADLDQVGAIIAFIRFLVQKNALPNNFIESYFRYDPDNGFCVEFSVTKNKIEDFTVSQKRNLGYYNSLQLEFKSLKDMRTLFRLYDLGDKSTFYDFNIDKGCYEVNKDKLIAAINTQIDNINKYIK